MAAERTLAPARAHTHNRKDCRPRAPSCKKEERNPATVLPARLERARTASHASPLVRWLSLAGLRPPLCSLRPLRAATPSGINDVLEPKDGCGVVVPRYRNVQGLLRLHAAHVGHSPANLVRHRVVHDDKLELAGLVDLGGVRVHQQASLVDLDSTAGRGVQAVVQVCIGVLLAARARLQAYHNVVQAAPEPHARVWPRGRNLLVGPATAGPTQRNP
mmetsp:Transcript_88155/g.262841  ORF Transcript_88155/g.262841 Transcript_88155/m.262841 type:complete len:217 (-) Transcript_88155:316-966(-)